MLALKVVEILTTLFLKMATWQHALIPESHYSAPSNERTSHGRFASMGLLAPHASLTHHRLRTQPTRKD